MESGFKKLSLSVLVVAASMIFTNVANSAQKQWYYQDNDQDLYGDYLDPGIYTNKPEVDCLGCVSNNLDCDDRPAGADGIPGNMDDGSNINLDARELGGNSIDYNCDGDPGPTFTDPNLEACILSHTGGSYYQDDIENITYLDCGFKNLNISDLTGINYLTGATALLLERNLISDLLPLAGLINLNELWLDENQIYDISPLSNLNALQQLGLGSNHISNISSLSGLTNLWSLGLYYNELDSIAALENLTNLQHLNLARNNISGDLTSLANLYALRELAIYMNNISSLSGLENHTNLWSISLYDNLIENLSPLANATSLWSIYLAYNCITDFTPIAHVPYIFGEESQCM